MSSLTEADPCPAPWVEIHAIWLPVNDSVAVLPAAVAYLTDPPLAPERFWFVQPDEYVMALELCWISDNL